VAVRVRVQVSEAEVRRLLTGPSGLATRYVMRKTDQIVNRARMYCPVDTGNLRSSIVAAVREENGRVVGLVGTPVEYAAAVHEGYRTSRGRRVGGRPFLRRAMNEVMGTSS
jgi:phage gpG-like protein